MSDSPVVNDQNIPFEEPPLKKSKSVSGSSTPVPIPQTIASVPSPVKQETPESIIKRSGKTIEEIIDGSEVRRFLNKTLTEYMVKGLQELIDKWENGGLEIKGNDDDKKVVVNEFCNILKDISNKEDV